MARIPYPNPADAPERVQEALAAVPALNIFRMLSHAETALRPYLRFGGVILRELELDPRLRELAILQVAKQSGAEYEWVQHAEIGRLVGLGEDHIRAVGAGEIDSSPAFDELERAVLRFTSEVLDQPRVSDETFDAVAGRLSPREIVELLLTIGAYLMLARVMTTLELEIDEPAGGQVAGGPPAQGPFG